MNPSTAAWTLPGPHLTSSAAGQTQSPHPATVTNDISSDDGDFAALIGGIVAGVVLVLTCIILVLLWCLSRHKGSYVTNEMDDEEMVREEEDDEDDESLQLKQPLQSKGHQ